MTTRTEKTKSKGRVTARKAKTSVLPGKGGLRLVPSGRESKLELRARLGMTRALFSRLVNVSERTLAKVEGASETADKLKRPYNEVERLYAALAEIVDPAILGEWFETPNDGLNELKPIEIIERGEIDRLWEMVWRLRSGMPG